MSDCFQRSCDAAASVAGFLRPKRSLRLQVCAVSLRFVACFSALSWPACEATAGLDPTSGARSGREFPTALVVPSSGPGGSWTSRVVVTVPRGVKNVTIGLLDSGWSGSLETVPLVDVASNVSTHSQNGRRLVFQASDLAAANVRNWYGQLNASATDAVLRFPFTAHLGCRFEDPSEATLWKGRHALLWRTTQYVSLPDSLEVLGNQTIFWDAVSSDSASKSQVGELSPYILVESDAACKAPASSDAGGSRKVGMLWLGVRVAPLAGSPTLELIPSQRLSTGEDDGHKDRGHRIRSAQHTSRTTQKKGRGGVHGGTSAILDPAVEAAGTMPSQASSLPAASEASASSSASRGTPLLSRGRHNEALALASDDDVTPISPADELASAGGNIGAWFMLAGRKFVANRTRVLQVFASVLSVFVAIFTLTGAFSAFSARAAASYKRNQSIGALARRGQPSRPGPTWSSTVAAAAAAAAAAAGRSGSRGDDSRGNSWVVHLRPSVVKQPPQPAVKTTSGVATSAAAGSARVDRSVVPETG
eukprot:TRINITY_DN40811_c0_g2_i1.p1 TRINITY_DN40811_c0_g2~~TRINITY_DN40811_c0_g2_i1.p1  ORF type:complete len:534 (+),score=87.56 TRINITY_DN40811_c0_g2_i1:237-1838(+)